MKKVKKKCDVCGHGLCVGEATLCASCITFLEWKYGSLENFALVRRKALNKIGGGLK